MLCMVVKVISHECGDEVIGVVVVFVHPQHHWHVTRSTSIPQVFWQKLTISVERVCLSLGIVMEY